MHAFFVIVFVGLPFWMALGIFSYHAATGFRHADDE